MAKMEMKVSVLDIQEVKGLIELLKEYFEDLPTVLKIYIMENFKDKDSDE